MTPCGARVLAMTTFAKMNTETGLVDRKISFHNSNGAVTEREKLTACCGGFVLVSCRFLTRGAGSSNRSGRWSHQKFFTKLVKVKDKVRLMTQVVPRA